MRKLRFYYPEQLITFQELALDQKSQHHHIKHVLRLKVGDTIELFNHHDNVAEATITNVGRNNVHVQVGTVTQQLTKSSLSTHIGQVVTKSTAMDFFIQKATELGVSKITPLIGEHTNIRKAGNKLEDKKQHWKNVAISACAQAYRNDIPTIADAVTVDEWLAMKHTGAKLLLNPDPNDSETSFSQHDSYNLLFGPF